MSWEIEHAGLKAIVSLARSSGGLMRLSFSVLGRELDTNTTLL